VKSTAQFTEKAVLDKSVVEQGRKAPFAQGRNVGTSRTQQGCS